MPQGITKNKNSTSKNTEKSEVIKKEVPAPESRLEKLMREEKRMVKGVFRFHECPGGTLTVPMKKYRGAVYNCNLTDGQEATVPLWVARWLNGYDSCAQALGGKINSCGYVVHQNAVDKSTGVPLITVGHVHRRMAFESHEFMAA